MKWLDKSITRKKGIEIWQPYIDRKMVDEEIVQGDFRNFEDFLDGKQWDVAMFIDTIEHLVKEDAIDVLNRVKKYFQRIILVTPLGRYEQSKDNYKLGNDFHQTHKSYWTMEEFDAMGFETTLLKNLHPDKPKSPHTILAKWTKPNEDSSSVSEPS